MSGILIQDVNGATPLPGSIPANQRLWIGAFLLLLTAAVYAQVGGFAFLTLDDPLYLTHNPHVRSGLTWETLRWSFTTVESGNYSPLVWLSHAACWSLFGANAGPHHLVNLGLHLANTLLLFQLLCALTGDRWPSALVAVVFALHPSHVESVAWVSGRKDVLSFLFWLLSVRAYMVYARTASRAMYAKVALFFLLGLLSKAVLVTLPLTLLLLDLWPLNRIDPENEGWAGIRRRGMLLIREKIPLFVLMIGFSLATFLAQRAAGAVSSSLELPLGIRLAQSTVSYLRYLANAFWPSGLSVHYPHPGTLPSPQALVGALLVLVGATLAGLWQLRRRPFLLVGWLWFLITLLPMIGIIQVGNQITADRYTYVSMTGLAIGLAWSGKDLAGARPRLRGILGAAALALLGILAGLTFRQTRYWKDGATLFKRALELDPANAVAHEHLGHLDRDEGRWLEAAVHYRKALASNPRSAELSVHLAEALERLGQIDGAIRLYQHTLLLDPANLGCEYRIATLLAQLGRAEQAMPHFQKVLASDPVLLRQDPEVTRNVLFASRLNLGVLLRDRKRFEEALIQFEEAIRIDPANPNPRILLALTQSDLGLHDRAVSQLRDFVNRGRGQTTATYFLGVVLAGARRYEEAIEVFEGIPATDPNAAAAQDQIKTIRRALPFPGSLPARPRGRPGRNS